MSTLLTLPTHSKVALKLLSVMTNSSRNHRFIESSKDPPEFKIKGCRCNSPTCQRRTLCVNLVLFSGLGNRSVPHKRTMLSNNVKFPRASAKLFPDPLRTLPVRYLYNTLLARRSVPGKLRQSQWNRRSPMDKLRSQHLSKGLDCIDMLGFLHMAFENNLSVDHMHTYSTQILLPCDATVGPYSVDTSIASSRSVVIDDQDDPRSPVPKKIRECFKCSGAKATLSSRRNYAMVGQNRVIGN